MDEPDHRCLRSLVSKPFTPGAVEKWRPRTREVVQRVLGKIDSDEFDLISDFAGPIPTVVIAEMLGVDPQMHADFKRWSDLSVWVRILRGLKHRKLSSHCYANTPVSLIATRDLNMRQFPVFGECHTSGYPPGHINLRKPLDAPDNPSPRSLCFVLPPYIIVVKVSAGRGSGLPGLPRAQRYHALSTMHFTPRSANLMLSS